MRLNTIKASLFLLLLVSNISFAGVYRWVDENGRVHFGDSKPETSTKSTDNLSKQYAQPRRNFEVTVTTVNYDLPLDTKRKIITTVKKIFYILNEYNQIPFPEDSSIDITLFGNQKEFINFQKKNLSAIVSNTGYYSRKSNQAFVWKNRSVKRMMDVITHEAFHTIMLTNYKHVPPWLNEGLAEYFELINVFGTAAAIPISKGWTKTVKAALLQKDVLPPVSEYLDMNHRQWHTLNKDGSISYAMGWSLTYYLMSSKKGRQLILNVLQETKKDKDALSTTIVENAYAGGVQKLQTDWESWVFGRKTAHRY